MNVSSGKCTPEAMKVLNELYAFSVVYEHCSTKSKLAGDSTCRFLLHGELVKALSV